VGESRTIDEGSGQPSIQERLFPTLRCFGCGPANPKGLRLRSFPAEGWVVARFAPWPEHDNGLGYLNGGIIATVLDCHSAAVVLLEAERNNWTAPVGVPLPYVTAGLDLRYLRPSPLGEAGNSAASRSPPMSRRSWLTSSCCGRARLGQPRARDGNAGCPADPSRRGAGIVIIGA